MEKAYKLLALKLGISNNKAKELIDSGLVSVAGKRLEVARKDLPLNTEFKVIEEKLEVLFKDSKVLAINKPVGVESYSLQDKFPDYKLLHRLDKDTSGVLLLSSDPDFIKRAKEEFKEERVTKNYLALVDGNLKEALEVTKPIGTKKGFKAQSFIKSHTSPKDLEYKSATSKFTPLQFLDNKTLVLANILTGRTHQIRVHLASIKHPIVGDIIYGKTKSNRLKLHAFSIKLLDYEFKAPINLQAEFDKEAMDSSKLL
ncbi:RluA family pseudouridine synthase [Helicobacter sp. 11S02629-2]|uniref:pseudouridine synthase family protein n=1 Tax=Helicobacter sp. 11S02629-2 TaxID=1476195 RepID=UPI000BA6DC6F|nr:RluA family pseudouridine synthase [Helicobacter sp. 11S02629-2]PAF45565.1 hypothetical protein BKH40_01400 [Helicobacter sp. 11S02629-2]